MPGQQITDNSETLFSFELLVENIRIEKHCKVSDELALGVRLLDFPTLLIYQPRQSSASINYQPEQNGGDKRGEYAFHRGKSCFFKMNLMSLHVQLCNTPLYAMVLDVKEETPRLVGSCLISLAKVMDRIRQDVTERGVSTPSSHRERGIVGICNLTGDKIGSISLSYKLLCLGASLLPHITERTGLKSTSGGLQERVKEKNKSTESLPLECGHMCSLIQDRPELSGDIQNNGLANAKILLNENKQDEDAERRPTSQNENHFEEDLTVFCPPHLYYSNSAEEKSKAEEVDYKLLNIDSEAFTLQDSCSEDEEDEKEARGSVMHLKARHNAKVSSNQETSGVTPNVLGEAVRQLPLLNALLVELSQLNGQIPQQSLTVHPSLAWIYKPASTEPSAGHGNTPQNAQTKSLQKARQGTSPHLKHLHPPRNCSTPIARPASVKVNKQEEALIKNKSSSKSPRKKLVYGTTKTFDLRLKRISPLKVKHRECQELIQNETQSSMVKGKTKPSNKTLKSSKRKSVLKQSSNLSENTETVIESVTVDSALRGTITLKQKNHHVKVHVRQDRGTERILEKSSLSERDLKFIHIPGMDSDSVPQSKDKNEHHSEADQSQSESDRGREKIQSAGSSRCSSPNSSFSNLSRKENEEADYADDFNSLEPSDAYSPDPMSSPEPFRTKTPKSPVLFYSDSGSEGVQRRAAVLPVPVKASSSPQRAMRGTHIIRPRTHTLSLSSSEGDRGGSASLQTSCSRKLTAASSRVEWSSGGESFISSRGQRAESTKNSDTVRGFSVESRCSFEPQEVGELEDELGSLDFRKEYQHISQLVASKLPGYTM
uniref:Microtubule associated protein 10 n=1 Tax=Stegastes partitus TaxID=144197 RepID=A0A3B4ZJ43_9TELE